MRLSQHAGRLQYVSRLLEQRRPLFMNEQALLKGRFLNLGSLLKLEGTFNLTGATVMCVTLHVTLFQTQQLGAPRKHP